jgi:hypothetical protein
MKTTNENRINNILRIIGEVISQILNVPVLSGLLVIIICFSLPPNTPNRLTGFWWAFSFISLIPLCSLFFYIPGKEHKWPVIKKRQRIASFVFMIISYPIGFIILHYTNAPKIYEAIALHYTLITLGLIFFNLILRYKASGHAAGVAGPVAAMVYFFGFVATPLIALLPLTTFARVMAKGHDIWQTVVGALLSALITLSVLWAYGFLPFAHIAQ